MWQLHITKSIAMNLLQVETIKKKLLGPMKALSAMRKAAESGGK